MPNPPPDIFISFDRSTAAGIQRILDTLHNKKEKTDDINVSYFEGIANAINANLAKQSGSDGSLDKSPFRNILEKAAEDISNFFSGEFNQYKINKALVDPEVLKRLEDLVNGLSPADKAENVVALKEFETFLSEKTGGDADKKDALALLEKSFYEERMLAPYMHVIRHPGDVGRNFMLALAEAIDAAGKGWEDVKDWFEELPELAQPKREGNNTGSPESKPFEKKDLTEQQKAQYESLTARIGELTKMLGEYKEVLLNSEYAGKEAIRLDNINADMVYGTIKGTLDGAANALNDLEEAGFPLGEEEKRVLEAVNAIAVNMEDWLPYLKSVREKYHEGYKSASDQLWDNDANNDTDALQKLELYNATYKAILELSRDTFKGLDRTLDNRLNAIDDRRGSIELDSSQPNMLPGMNPEEAKAAKDVMYALNLPDGTSGLTWDELNELAPQQRSGPQIG